MWQMGGPGPMLGQVHHFVKYNKGKAPYAEERYLKEGHRLYKVLNTRLEGRAFVADEYSIADIAIWPWISRFEWQTIDMKQYPNVSAGTRPSPRAPPCRRATRCPRTWARSRCRDGGADVIWRLIRVALQFALPLPQRNADGRTANRARLTPPSCCGARARIIVAANWPRPSALPRNHRRRSPAISTRCTSMAC